MNFICTPWRASGRGPLLARCSVRSVVCSTVCRMCLVIRDGELEYLIPAVREFIVAIDETEIVFDLPPGLLEINR